MEDNECRHRSLIPFKRIAPSVWAPAYQLAMNGTTHAMQARFDAMTWPDRVASRARALKEFE